jgi:hypothetical protein
VATIQPELQSALQLTWDQIDALWRRVDDPQSWGVEDGSSLLGDDTQAYPYRISNVIRSELSCSVDHLMMVSRCINSLRVIPPIALFPLFRAALETACTAHWLLAPRSRAQRVQRRLKLESNNADDLLKASKELAAAKGEAVGPLEEGTERTKAQLHALAVKAGLEGVGGYASYEKIVKASDSEVQGLNVSALAQWRVFSGITHGRQWAMRIALGGDIISTSPDGRIETMDLETQPQHVFLGAHLGTLVASEALALFDKRRSLQR